MKSTQFNPREFLIELFKYYMEFLETDFRENRPPSRKVTFHNKDGLLTCPPKTDPEDELEYGLRMSMGR
jgi:hypothetical protein